MANSTVLTNLKVTGILDAGTTKIGGLSDVTRPANKAGDHFTDNEIKAIVDAVNGILTALGKPTS